MLSNVYDFGYGGVQQVDWNTGRVIFSLWDQGGCDQDKGNCNPDDMAKTVACGSGVICTGFGGEGTGRKSYFDTSLLPNTDEEYYFVTQAKYLGNNRMEHTGYFYASALGGWKLLSRIEVSTNNNQKWWLSGLYSFVEQWDAIKTTEDRAALFGPSYMADENGQDFYQIRSGTFNHGTLENHEHVNAWQAGDEDKYAIGIETGGTCIPTVPKGQSFDYVLMDPYEILKQFKQKIPCLKDASTKQAIEACLDPGTSPTPAPTPSPTKSPSSSCIVCDDVPKKMWKNKGKDCTTQTKAIQKYCNKNKKWRKKKLCQLTCYNANNGYDGDVCCNGSIKL